MSEEMAITEFCKRHNACADGRKWAVGTGCTTMEDLWMRDDMRCDWREWIATRHGVLTDRELRLYACWCVRQVWHLLTDERSKHAVEVAELYADGKATDAELEAAREAARDAAREAAWEAAWEAARAAALDAVRAAALDAAGAAAWAAAWEAARDAARAAALDAVRAATLEAAREAQSKWLIENTKPNFQKGGGG